MNFKEQIDDNRIPQHIAIIMDGNGRWAKERWGRSRIFGHKNGVAAVRTITEACAEIGVKYLTLYAFSTENWGRPAAEVTALMNLLVSTIRKEVKQLNENKVRLHAIGDIESLPKQCYNELLEGMSATQHNQRLQLTLALSYSSRWEITQAMQQIAEKVAAGSIQTSDIDEQLINNHLATKDMPDPELLIRTSGELRISNYLLWQIAYTELYFTKKFWPDFKEEDLYEAIYHYQQRERRFGKLKSV